MKLFVVLAIFEGCPKGWLNHPASLDSALQDAIAEGCFTPYHIVIQPFHPQGVTACAVLGESHVALHSWPEEGRLFVDIASCSTMESVRMALGAIEKALPEGKLAVVDERVIDPETRKVT